MAKPLVIVESPAKAKTLGRFLGKDYRVEASYGHIRDLPESAADVPKKIKQEEWGRLGVNVEEDFKPLYVIPSEKKKQVKSSCIPPHKFQYRNIIKDTYVPAKSLKPEIFRNPYFPSAFTIFLQNRRISPILAKSAKS